MEINPNSVPGYFKLEEGEEGIEVLELPESDLDFDATSLFASYSKDVNNTEIASLDAHSFTVLTLENDNTQAGLVYKNALSQKTKDDTIKPEINSKNSEKVDHKDSISSARKPVEVPDNQLEDLVSNQEKYVVAFVSENDDGQPFLKANKVSHEDEIHLADSSKPWFKINLDNGDQIAMNDAARALHKKNNNQPLDVKAGAGLNEAQRNKLKNLDFSKAKLLYLTQSQMEKYKELVLSKIRENNRKTEEENIAEKSSIPKIKQQQRLDDIDHEKEKPKNSFLAKELLQNPRKVYAQMDWAAEENASEMKAKNKRDQKNKSEKAKVENASIESKEAFKKELNDSVETKKVNDKILNEENIKKKKPLKGGS